MQEALHNKAKKMFLSNENYVEWLTPAHVRCSVCSSSQGFVTDFLKHCRTKSRRRKAYFVPYNGNTTLAVEIPIDLSKEIFDCWICQDKYVGIDGLIWHCQFDHKIYVVEEHDDSVFYH